MGPNGNHSIVILYTRFFLGNFQLLIKVQMNWDFKWSVWFVPGPSLQGQIGVIKVTFLRIAQYLLFHRIILYNSTKVFQWSFCPPGGFVKILSPIKMPKMWFYFMSTLQLHLGVWSVSTRHCVSLFSNYFLEWHSVN